MTGVNATGVKESERLARVVLSRIGEPGDPRLTDLVHQLGGEMVLASLRHQAADRELGADLAERLESADPVLELERASAQGIRFVVPGDAEWPAGLDDLAHAPHLHERGGVPVGLWCRGKPRLDQVTEQAVSVVGSRSATTYGADVAADIAGTLARASWTVVSGAAFGIDDCGLVVSEAPPGCAPTRIRFLARNRVIAGLTRGAVVVEAAVRSGALNTANWAGGLGRTVMAVPGPVTSAPSAGAHQLIRARDALLVTSGEEVLEAVGPIGSFTLEDPREPEHPRDLLPRRERQVLDAVPLVQAVDSSSIARTAGIAHGRTKDALLVLHRAGLSLIHISEPT